MLYNTSFYNGTSTTTAPNADRKSTASATTTTEHDSASTDGYDAAVTTATQQLMFSNVYKGDNQQQQMLDCKILLVPFAMMES